MKKRTIHTGMLVLIALLALGLCIPTDTWAGVLERLSAEFRNFDFAGSETSTIVGVAPLPGTAAGDDGVVVYTKTLFVPPGLNTLFVTISATGDTHAGSALLLSCRVDGAFCNPGPSGASAVPPGWIALQKHFNYDTTYTPAPNDPLAVFAPNGDGGGGRGDMHDNSLNYTWCTKVPPSTAGAVGGVHRVEIRMATSSVGDRVFFENAHFYIDAAKLRPGSDCVQGAPTEPIS